ncbi:MAG TPA: hypothetical protein VFT40_08310 [Sphingomicrobium sp.]|nr:hypothetical protein [Sphingomicrobium sp.]
MLEKKFRNSAAAALALTAIGLSGCMSATPYQPYVAERASGVHGGYSEQQLAPDFFLVRFHGNELASRERVEGYLLYRAAELTLQRGFDWFHPVTSHTEHEIRTYTTSDPLYRPYYGYPYWRPYWGYSTRGYGWNYWDPWMGGAFWYDSIDVHTIEAFEATAEISMHKGPILASEPRAMDARMVMARLGPTIELPKRR